MFTISPECIKKLFWLYFLTSRTLVSGWRLHNYREIKIINILSECHIEKFSGVLFGECLKNVIEYEILKPLLYLN